MGINVMKLRGKIVEKGYSIETFIKAAGIGRALFYRRLKDTSKFTLGEAHKICDALGLTWDEAIAIFLPDYSH